MQIDNDLMNTNVSHNALWNISGEQYTGGPGAAHWGAVELQRQLRQL